MESTKPGIDRAGMAIAAALAVIAAVILWDATSLPAPVYGIGPRAMPILVASVAALVGLTRSAQAADAAAQESEGAPR